MSNLLLQSIVYFFYKILLLQTYKIKKQDAFIFNKHDFINKIYKLL